MTAVWKVIQKAGAWIRDNPWALLVALGGVFGAYFIVRSKQNKINKLSDAVVVQATLKDIAATKAKAEVLKQQADAKSEDIAALDKKVAASKRRVVEISEGKPLEGASDEEIADMFSGSGL